MDARILLDEQIAPDGRSRLVRAMLELRGSPPSGAAERPPLDLSLVLDRSGSMHGAKLEAAKKAASDLVRRLSPRDVVSVVAYATEVEVVAEPGTGDEQHALITRIDAIQTAGSTNLSGGWLRGRQLVEQGRAKIGEGDRQSIDRVLLLTDGLANVGLTDPQQLTGLARRAAEQGITTTTIGFGGDYDEHLLRAMADAGGGGTYYIERVDQAGDVFADELEGLLEICAQNLRATVASSDAVRAMIVRHGYAGAQTEHGLRLELGDLYAREPKRLLLEMVVATDGADEDVTAAEIVVTGDVVAEDGSIEQRELRLPIVVSRDGELRVDAEVRREALLLEAADARRQAMDDQRRGDWDGARMKLADAADRLTAEAAPDDDELREQAADLRGLAERSQPAVWEAADAKYMHQRMYDASTSRRSKSDMISRVRREEERKRRAEERRRRKQREGEGDSNDLWSTEPDA